MEALFDGSKPFTDLQKELKGITAKVLTENLYFLVKHGILVKRSYPVFPPRVEYALSDTGEKIRPILNAVYAWGLENYVSPMENIDGYIAFSSDCENKTVYLLCTNQEKFYETNAF